MKIVCKLMFLAIIWMVGGGGIAGAEMVEKPLLIETKGGETEVSQALCDGNEILFPAKFIADHVYSTVVLDNDNSQLKTHFAAARFRLPEKNLSKQIIKNNFIQLPYKNVNGVSYIDAVIAGRIFGFTIDDQIDKVVVKTNVYSSFKPQVLSEKMRILPKKTVLSWQPVFSADVDLSRIEKMPGLNVVSPSWMAVVSKNGMIDNKSDYRYVKEAQAKGYQVWPLITNSFDQDLTHAVLQDEQARNRLIKEMVTYAKLYEFDGINIDFEAIYDEDRDLLSAFVQEASTALKAAGLITSIDVTVPGKMKCYDRKALAEQVDYMMLMAYDEHWRTSPVSGSVASIGWVEQGIVNTLKEVPAEKIVLGVPLYMRRWEENGNAVKAKTMTMSEAEETIRDKRLKPQWLPESGQYYFEYWENSLRYRVWQEEARSIALKVNLANQYGLAGVAVWRKGFEKTEIWNIIESAMFPVTNEEKFVK